MIDPVLMRRSDSGEISLYDKRDKFMASFKNGEWFNDLLFSDYELEEFNIIENEDEIWRVIDEARAVLRMPLKQARAG